MSTITIEPPIDEWQALAEGNRKRIRSALKKLPFAVTASELNEFRKQVLSAARRYTSEQLDSEYIPGGSDDLIFAAGHQPVIYHPGVFRKNVTLHDACRKYKARGINVIVDTDTGSAGLLSYPVSHAPGEFGIGSVSLAQGGEVYLSQVIRRLPELEALFTQLRQEGVHIDQHRVAMVERHYRNQAGRPVAIANAILRRSFEGEPEYDELLLTELISLPLARRFYASVVASAVDFVTLFNSELVKFRADHRIKNHANPFPNLQVQDGVIELPFWAIDRVKGTRSAVFLREADGILMADGKDLAPVVHAENMFNWSEESASPVLAPRALMITALIRLLVSDYFLHGLGGARYDAFLDRLFTAYWKVDPPHFAIVSETRTLMPEELEQLEHRSAVLSKSREIQFHLGDYLENGTFDPVMNATLRELWNQRVALVEKLKRCKEAGESAAPITQDLKGVDSAIKEQLQQFFSSIILPSERSQKVIRHREFPFFFFDLEERL